MAMQLSVLLMGLILANWLVYGMSTYSGSIQWRFPCAFQLIFCTFVMCFTPFLPESPRYLCASGQIEKAIRALTALRGGDSDTPEIALELREIKYAIAVESQDVGSWSDVFKDNGMSG